MRPFGTTTRRGPGGGGPWSVVIVLAALAVIVAPVVWATLQTRAHRPETHPSFDGHRYVFPVERLRDAERPDQVAATLLAWRDGGAATADGPLLAPGAASPDRGETPDSIEELIARTEATLSRVGLTGEWRDGAEDRLRDLPPPFLAPIELDGRISMLVVRRIHSGFVFAFEPGVGDVLYAWDTFVGGWSGRIRTFEPSVPAPELWR